jgi:hypothetical protein
MINATISETGEIILSAFGNDADTLKAASGNFKVVPVGTNISPKTGRKHFIIKLIPVGDVADEQPAPQEAKTSPQPKKKRTPKEELDFKEQMEKSYPEDDSIIDLENQ